MAPTPRQRDLIDELIEELDLDLETALEEAEMPGEDLDNFSPEQASEFIEWLLQEKRNQKGS